MKKTAYRIVERLQHEGFEAYIAGGAVRDMLLGKDHKDIDIATSATPEQIEEIFQQTYAIGRAFGVIVVHQDGYQFEVATFRSDSGYSDGRRPDFVTFTDAKEDALRRDFTVNGMFYDPIADKVVDYVGGQKDLEAKVIRFIGDPSTRIQEDHLRLLRAIRFAHQTESYFEPATYRAIAKLSHLISGVSWERIRDEFDKILLLPSRVEALEDLQDVGLLKQIFPELEALKGVAQPSEYHKEGTVWSHVMQALTNLKGERANINLIWATLLHDIGKPDTFHIDERIRFDGHAKRSAEIAAEVLKRFRYPNRMSKDIIWAVEHHMSLFHLIEDRTSELRKRTWFTHSAFPLLLELHRADIEGTTPSDLSSYTELKQEFERVISEEEHKVPKLVTGVEVASWSNLSEGPELGKLMKLIYQKQLLLELRTKAEIKAFVEQYASNS